MLEIIFDEVKSNLKRTSILIQECFYGGEAAAEAFLVQVHILNLQHFSNPHSCLTNSDSYLASMVQMRVLILENLLCPFHP